NLVAYLTEAQNDMLDPLELKRAIGEILPDYMVPAHFIVLDQFPVSPTGKLDRRALPIPASATIPSETAAKTSDKPAEEILAGIWCAVLAVERVERTANFFELGGHSLLAIRALSRIREAFSVDLPLRVLFMYPTISELAAEIERLSGVSTPIRL